MNHTELAGSSTAGSDETPFHPLCAEQARIIALFLAGNDTYAIVTEAYGIPNKGGGA